MAIEKCFKYEKESHHFDAGKNVILCENHNRWFKHLGK